MKSGIVGFKPTPIMAAHWFRKLNEVLRSLPAIIGDGKKTILKEEENIAAKLRYWLEE